MIEIQDIIMKILIEDIPGFKELIIDSFPEYQDIESFKEKYNNNPLEFITLSSQDIDNLANNIIDVFPDKPIDDIVSVLRDVLISLNEMENETLTCSLDNFEIVNKICDIVPVRSNITKIYLKLLIIEMELKYEL